jgi:hypothetical protein
MRRANLVHVGGHTASVALSAAVGAFGALAQSRPTIGLATFDPVVLPARCRDLPQQLPMGSRPR